MTSLTRVASVALLTSSLAGPVYASNVSAPTLPQTPPTSASTTQQTAPAASPSHAEDAAISKTTSSVSTQNSPPATDKNVHTESTPTAEQTSAPQQKTPASTQSTLTADKTAHTENTQNTAQTPTPQQQAPTSTQDTTTDKNAHAGSASSSEESAQGSHTAAAAAAASSQNTPSPQAPLVVDTQSFTDAGIPSNDEKSWVGIGVRDGHTAASLNHIFEQTVSNPHHKETDNPEFFNNIHPIVDALNDHKFTLGDLSTLIAEHHHQEEEGKAEELGPDLTNIIIDSAAKIHHGASAQETVSEITAQQHAIDEAEKKEQND